MTTGVLPENGYLAAATAHKAAATGTLPEDGYLAAIAERLWQRQPLPGAPTTTTTNDDDTDCHRLRIKIATECLFSFFLRANARSAEWKAHFLKNPTLTKEKSNLEKSFPGNNKLDESDEEHKPRKQTLSDKVFKPYSEDGLSS